MGILRFLTKEVVNSLGCEVRRIPRSSNTAGYVVCSGDPITYQYIPHLRGCAVFDIKVKDARGLHGFALKFQSQFHPFVAAVMAAKGTECEAEALEALQTSLSEYYWKVRPSSALEAVGLPEDDAPGLKGVPACGWLLPWVDKSVAEATRRRQTAMQRDALQYGKMLTDSEGLTEFGPVGTKKLSLEVSRLHSLMTLVAENGFAPSRDPMTVVGLRRDRTYRWLVAQGQHRFAVCAAFSIPSLPAQVFDIVRREDCEYWPQVVSGVYRPKGALALFDRLFDGVPARVCDSWIRRTPSTVLCNAAVGDVNVRAIPTTLVRED